MFERGTRRVARLILPLTLTMSGGPIWAHQQVAANDSLALPSAMNNVAVSVRAPATQPERTTAEGGRALSERQPLGAVHVPHQVTNKGEDAADSGIFKQLDPRRNEVTRVGGALSVVLGVLLLCRLFLKRAAMTMRGAGRPSGVIEILSRYPVGRGQQLVLIKLARRIVLAHLSGSTMRAISELTDPDEVAGLLARMEAGASERAASRFRAVLNEFATEQATGADPRSPRRARRSLPMGDAEIVDLTRRQSGWLAWLSGRAAR